MSIRITGGHRGASVGPVHNFKRKRPHRIAPSAWRAVGVTIESGFAGAREAGAEGPTETAHKEGAAECGRQRPYLPRTSCSSRDSASPAVAPVRRS
jgi:hypothetical protein